MATTVLVEGVYPPTASPSTTGLVISGDGHLVGWTTVAQFGTVTPSVNSPIFTPPGLGSAQAFGTITRITGGVSSSASGVPSAQAFGAIRAAYVVHVNGVGSAQAFGVPWLIYPQWVHVLGVPSAQAFGNAAGGLQVFIVWLHEFTCIDDVLVPVGVTDLVLQPAGCL